MASNPIPYNWSDPKNAIINSGSTGYGGMRQISKAEQAQRDDVNGEYYAIQHPIAAASRGFEEQAAVQRAMQENPNLNESQALQQIQSGYATNRLNRAANTLQNDMQGVLGNYGPQTPDDWQAPTPADQADAKSQEIQGALSENQQTQVDLASKGYKAPPDASQDPAGYLAALNENKTKGVGGFSGVANTPLPTPPTQSQVQDMGLNEQGKQAAFDQNKIPAWYKSNSFNMGLISFGLNLLSGNDLATSFNAAGEAFNQMYGEERRSYWTEDLIKQGYDPIEVDEWRRTGDSKILTSPQEKQMKMIQQRLAMQNLDNALYEGSPEMRQYQLGREQRKDALTEAQIRNSIANSNAQLGLSRERLNFEKSKYEAKQAAAGEGPEWGITNPEARMVLQQGKKFTDDSNLKRSRMAVAHEAAQRAKQLLEAGDTAGAAAAYDQYEESYGKAMQGGLGKIDREDASDIAGPRTWGGQIANKLVRGVRGAPTQSEIERAISSADRGISTEHQVVVDNLQSMYENLIPKIGADRARAAVKFQANGSGIGNWEPKASRANVTFH